eukprot:Sspe_Gene.89197::Locus_61021_Transcript_1_1_Confidence_1.000_Length_839::g.89197::m.89197
MADKSKFAAYGDLYIIEAPEAESGWKDATVQGKLVPPKLELKKADGSVSYVDLRNFKLVWEERDGAMPSTAANNSFSFYPIFKEEGVWSFSFNTETEAGTLKWRDGLYCHACYSDALYSGWLSWDGPGGHVNAHVAITRHTGIRVFIPNTQDPAGIQAGGETWFKLHQIIDTSSILGFREENEDDRRSHIGLHVCGYKEPNTRFFSGCCLFPCINASSDTTVLLVEVGDDTSAMQFITALTKLGVKRLY